MFAGKRGGTGNRAAAGTAADAPPQRHPEISSQWIRPGNVNLLLKREIASDPAEQEYIQSLLMDADWSHRFGTRRFTRVLRAVVSRDEIDNVATAKVSTAALLSEVMATIADEEAIEAGGTAPQPRPATTITQGILYVPTVITDEPVIVRIDATVVDPSQSGYDADADGSGGGSGSGGDGDVAAADTRPPLPRLRSRVPASDGKDRAMLRPLREDFDEPKYTMNLITDDISIDTTPSAVRSAATGLLAHVHKLLFPGDPVRHHDDSLHRQFVNNVLSKSPPDYRRSIAYLNEEQGNWMAHYVVLYRLMPMLWLTEEYSPNDAAYGYKGYDTRCEMSRKCIPLIKRFLKSLRCSICRSADIKYETLNSPMHYVPWITNEECWVIDVMKFYYDIHGHPSPDFRTFDPVIHYFMPQSEECVRNKGIFSSCFMGRGMREFIANQPPTWHLVEFPNAKPLADADRPDKRDQAIREAFTDDKDKFGEYLVLQITEGGAYVLELGSMKTIPLLDCSSKSFATALEYNKIRRGDILRGIEPIYVPDLLAYDRYCYPNDALVKANMDHGTVHQLIVDHESGTSPIQKMLRLKYGTKWTAVKSADKRVVDYILNFIGPSAKTISTKGEPLFEFFDRSYDAIAAVINKSKIHSFNPLWIEDYHEAAVVGVMYHLEDGAPGLLTTLRTKELNNMAYIPPISGVAVAESCRVREGLPSYWVPNDDLIYTELYSLYDHESPKGPFGEAFLRLSCYHRSESGVHPMGYSYPAHGKFASHASASGSGGDGDIAAAAAGQAEDDVADRPLQMDKTIIELDPAPPAAKHDAL